MIKVMISLLCCLFVQYSMSMEKKDLTLVPLDELAERTPVESYEGLRLLATGLQGKWDDISKKYDIKPEALAGYMACVERKKATVDECSLLAFKRLYDKDPEMYTQSVEQIMDILWQQESGKPAGALSKVLQRFQRNITEREQILEEEIIKIKPEHSDKRCCCIWHVTGNVMAGLAVVSGLGVIGLFSWVIDHCHEPWG